MANQLPPNYQFQKWWPKKLKKLKSPRQEPREYSQLATTNMAGCFVI
jgi:hypothetical protein